MCQTKLLYNQEVFVQRWSYCICIVGVYTYRRRHCITMSAKLSVQKHTSTTTTSNVFVVIVPGLRSQPHLPVHAGPITGDKQNHQ